jgi:hypothetical protein
LNATPLEAFRFVCALVGTAYTARVLVVVVRDHRTDPTQQAHVNLVTHWSRMAGISLLLLVSALGCIFKTWSPAWTNVGQLCTTAVIVDLGFISWWTFRGKRKVRE